jgi:hypothetical protein
MLAVQACDALFSHGHQQLALMIEFEDLVQSDICDPNIVVLVNTQPMGEQKSIGPPRGYKRSGSSIEAQDSRRRDWLRKGFAQDGMISPMENENVVVGINSHAGDVAQYKAFRENRPPMHHLIRSGGPFGWLPGCLFGQHRRVPRLVFRGQNESGRKRKYKGCEDYRSV